MEGGRIRLADVSPGPAFFRELEAEAQLARSLALRPAQYLASLDVLVAKYRDGLDGLRHATPRRCVVIPNGVPELDLRLAGGDGPAPPDGADPALAVVTVGRLVRTKRPELLPLVARELGELLPGATLTVVGGLHKDGETWPKLFGCDRLEMPHNLHFAGPDDRTLSFLDRFACFYMVSADQGCPNASLEAMSAGLPVVANPDGGTAEQVIDGVTGLLIADPGCAKTYARSLAAALASVLRDPARARTMGVAGQNHVRTTFSMAAMADAYAAALLNAEGGDNVDAVA
jgi:glycosyltransferase involved in cell wall biosynthesis